MFSILKLSNVLNNSSSLWSTLIQNLKCLDMITTQCLISTLINKLIRKLIPLFCVMLLNLLEPLKDADNAISRHFILTLREKSAQMCSFWSIFRKLVLITLYLPEKALTYTFQKNKSTENKPHSWQKNVQMQIHTRKTEVFALTVQQMNTLTFQTENVKNALKVNPIGKI